MSYQSEVLADSPYLYWALDDTAGVTAADSSGNGRTGTYNGSPTLAQSPLITQRTSVLFDATDDFCLSASAIFNSSTATVEVWFNYDGTPAAPTTGSMVAGCNEGDANSVGDKLIFINDAGKVCFHVFDGSAKLVVGSTVLGAGTYHLVGVVDATNTFAKIYLNGVENGTLVVAGSYAGYTNPNVMVGGSSTARGADPTGPDRKAGRRDEFAIYTTALSPARIQAHYLAGITDAPQVLSMQSHVFGHNMW